MKTINIFGVELDNINMEEATEQVELFLKSEKLNTIYTPNTEIVMEAKKERQLKELLNKGDLIIPDGIGLIYASRIRKKPLKERVTGFDLSIKMLEIANENNYSLYLLGGEEGVSKKAGENIKLKYPNINIVGYRNGYFKGSHNGNPNHIEERNIISEINDLKPDIIFVGLGFPRQEKWIEYNKKQINSKVIIGNGGVMDILSGNSKRAPEIFQKLGLEWFYRLLQEPSRIKRQIVLPKFMLEVILNKESVK